MDSFLLENADYAKSKSSFCRNLLTEYNQNTCYPLDYWNTPKHDAKKIGFCQTM